MSLKHDGARAFSKNQKQRWLIPLTIIGTIVGVLLFAKGFLRVRKLIEEQSSCMDAPIKAQFYPPESEGCWLKSMNEIISSKAQKSERLIIVVIDAVRLDFVLPSLQGQASSSIAWYDKLTVLSELRQDEPQNTQLFHLLADPPTATTQRLVGLSAGTLPAFIEIAANFAEDSLGSDNIVTQWLNQGRVIDVLGDDTWLHLFPKLRNQPSKDKALIAGYHSFHLFDLNTVDNGIKSHMFPRLRQTPPQYDILIAHFLGLDHCGHKFGPAHAQCGEKLREMDTVLREIITMMEEGTKLVVLGDHGMTDNGDHGGISEREVSTVLFSYTKDSESRASNSDEAFWTRFMADFNEKRKIGNSIGSGYFFEDTTNTSILNGAVSQLDFASTLALMSNTPIPWGNVGAIIPEMLINWKLYAHLPRQQARLANLRYLFDAFRQNAHQVQRFLLRSAQEGQIGLLLEDITPLLHHLQTMQSTQHPVNGEDEVALVRGITEHFEFLLLAQQHCRRVWANFDHVSIIGGLALGISGMLVLTIYYSRKRPLDFGSGFAMGLAMFHSLALGATSFVTFEDSLVCFLLLSFLIVEALEQWLSRRLSKESLKAIILAALLVRFTSWSKNCHEDQYPSCQTISHRSIPVRTSWKFGLALLIGIMGMGWVWQRCQAKLRRIESRSKLGKVLYLAIFVLLSIHWIWTWHVDTGNDASHQDLPITIDSLFSVSLPRLLYLLSFISGVLFRRHTFLLFVSVASFLGTLSRPFSGWMLLVPGLALLRLANSIFRKHSYKWTIFLHLVGSYLFFITGHQWSLTHLQWEAAFIGIRTTIQAISGSLVILNTFAGPLLVLLLVLREGTDEAINCFMWYTVTQTVAIASVTASLMHHLRVWKLFTPRFVLQAVLALMCLLFYALNYIFRLTILEKVAD